MSAPAITLAVELTGDQLDALAELVAEKLRATPAPERRLVDAQTVAAALGISRDTVYEHAAELGGVKVGDGSRPRWRFDLDRALSTWRTPSEPARATPRRRRRTTSAPNLLPVRDRRGRS